MKSFEERRKTLENFATSRVKSRRSNTARFVFFVRERKRERERERERERRAFRPTLTGRTMTTKRKAAPLRDVDPLHVSADEVCLMSGSSIQDPSQLVVVEFDLAIAAEAQADGAGQAPEVQVDSFCRCVCRAVQKRFPSSSEIAL